MHPYKDTRQHPLWLTAILEGMTMHKKEGASTTDTPSMSRRQLSLLLRSRLLRVPTIGGRAR